MPKKQTVATVQSCLKACKKDGACRAGCESAFTAGGGTITVQPGGKVFVDQEGGKVFIPDPK
jgi:hypothetical protein